MRQQKVVVRMAMERQQKVVVRMAMDEAAEGGGEDGNR